MSGDGYPWLALTVIWDNVVDLPSGERISRAEYERRTGYPRKPVWTPPVQLIRSYAD